MRRFCCVCSHAARAATLRLWNPAIESFATIPLHVPPQLANKKGGPKPWPDIDFVQNAVCNGQLTALSLLDQMFVLSLSW
jgi:hypothetical protein